MTTSPESSSPTLNFLFDQALALESQLTTLQATTDSYAQTVRSALDALEACRTLAFSRAALFSANESLDDLPTSSLRYLSVDYHLAGLIPRTPSTPSSSTYHTAQSSAAFRKSLVASARTAYVRFLSLLDDYGLLSAADRKLYAQISGTRDGAESFALLGATDADPARKREAKIARFREEKALRTRLEALEASAAASRRVAGTEEDEGDSDEDAMRDLRVAELRLQAHLAFQGLDVLAQEGRVLALAPSAEEEEDMERRRSAMDVRDRHGGLRDNEARVGYSERLDAPLRSLLVNGKAGPILDGKGKPLQPFTLLDSRQRISNGVFRPGHRLPTMTIDEYLEAEKARGGIIEGGGEPEVREPNEDDLEAADRETMKAREWDEFKEENPRGSGNTLNRG